MQRLPVESLLVEDAEDLIDDFTDLAADGLTPDEIRAFRRHLQRHLTRVDAHRHERAVIRSLDRCGLDGVWARRELARMWAMNPDDDDRTAPETLGAQSRRKGVERHKTAA